MTNKKSKKSKLISRFDSFSERISNLLFKDRIAIEKIFLIFGLVGGMMFSIMVPIFQTPDEQAHILMIQEELGLNGYTDAMAEYYLYIKANELPQKYKIKVDKKLYADSMDYKFDSSLKKTLHPNINCLRHLPADIGFVIALFMGLPIFWCMQLTEFFALLGYVLLGYIALKILPVKKELMMAFMLLPVALQQASSLNYDSFLMAVCFFLIAFLLYLKYDKEKTGWIDILIICISLLVIAVIKLPYVLIVFLFFMIPHEKISLKIGKFDLFSLIYKFRFWLAGIIVIAGCVGIYFIKSNIFINIIKLIALDLKHFVFAIVYSIIRRIWLYVISFFGSFGWLDSRISGYAVVLIVAFILIMTQVDYSNIYKNKKKLSDILVPIIAFVGVLCLIFAAMIDWTVKMNKWPENVDFTTWKGYYKSICLILGVQGRYFIPVAFLAVLPIKNFRKLKRSSALTLQLVFYPLLFIYCGIILYNRYWIG